MKRTAAALLVVLFSVPFLSSCGPSSEKGTVSFEEAEWAETEDSLPIDSRTDWSEPAL